MPRACGDAICLLAPFKSRQPSPASGNLKERGGYHLWCRRGLVSGLFKLPLSRTRATARLLHRGRPPPFSVGLSPQPGLPRGPPSWPTAAIQGGPLSRTRATGRPSCSAAAMHCGPFFRTRATAWPSIIIILASLKSDKGRHSA